MSGAGPRKTLVLCLLEANPLAFEQLCLLLQSHPGLRVASYDEAVAKEQAGEEVSLFLLDVGSLPYSLSKYLRTIRVRFRQARIIVLDHQEDEEALLGLLQLGVHGFVPYGEVSGSLVPAIRQVEQGRLWFGAEVLEKYVRYAQRSRLRAGGGDPLTVRERRIVELLHRRLANKELASALGISENTVKFHLANVYRKLGVHDRHSVVETALEQRVAGVAGQEVA